MNLHARAKLTLLQRQELRRKRIEERVPLKTLAQEFHVSIPTVIKWAKAECPLDKTSAPIHHATKITSEYRAAILAYRAEHPNRGPITIAPALSTTFPQANRGSVLRILQSEGLTRPAAKPHRERKHIPVGKHRIQMDIQTLPAIEGGSGREYKVSLIHLASRMKYSEIQSDRTSETVLEVFRRALDYLPPFFS